MSDGTHPEHWHFHAEAAAELDLQLTRFKATLESLAAEIAAAEPALSGPESPEVVYRRHVTRAATWLIRREPIAVHSDCQIFISYKTEDQPFADEIQNKLAAKGVRAFLAAASIDAGTDWEEAIFDALRACTSVLFVVTQRSRGSEWCSYEVGAARALGKEVQCVLRHASANELPLALKRFQAIEVQTTRQLNKLIKALAEKHSR
jgi:hypothetical protein